MKRFYWILIFAMIASCVVSCTKESASGSDNKEPMGEITVRGIIYDNSGSTMSGVVVSDGYKCVKTGGDGRFEIDSDLSKVKFVYVVLPSGYKVPVEGGKAQYYKRLGEGDAQDPGLGDSRQYAMSSGLVWGGGEAVGAVAGEQFVVARQGRCFFRSVHVRTRFRCKVTFFRADLCIFSLPRIQ